MKISYLSSTIAALALGITVLMAPPSYAIMPSESGSSETSSSSNNESNIALTIGKAIEKVASTISQVVSPQPSDSSAAQKAYTPVTKAVCRISIAYVMTYTPIISYTYKENRLIPIVTSLVVSSPIETRIC